MTQQFLKTDNSMRVPHETMASNVSHGLMYINEQSVKDIWCLNNTFRIQRPSFLKDRSKIRDVLSNK